MLESSWSFRLKLPQAEGTAFAGQDATNQHNLRHYDQIDLPFLKVSNAALQKWHVLGWPPRQAIC